MRPLTADEKALTDVARKKGNKQLSEQRNSLSLKLKMLNLVSPERPVLLKRIESLHDIKGCPVIVKSNNDEIVINYEMFRGFIRKLKNRQVTIKIDRLSSRAVLNITHSTGYNSKDFGSIELYSLPDYQMRLLIGLPVIEID